MRRPKKLTIFLVEGEPTGIKSIEVGNWTGKSYVIPRNKIKECLQDNEIVEELSSQGIYFLVGETESGERLIYVGEAEDYKTRLIEHHRRKDFWNTAISFISKDDNLTKAHIKYLECELVSRIEKADRARLKNTSNPAPAGLPRSDRAVMDEFLENIELVLSSLRFTFLQEIKPDGPIYFCKGPNALAQGQLTDEGFVIFKGSKIRKNERDSIYKGLKELRKKSIEKEELEDKGDHFILKKDKIISSPSYAAGYVTGGNENGWIKWKTEEGETLDELERNE